MRNVLLIVLAVMIAYGAGTVYGAVPIVDGPDSISSSSSLIVVRERYLASQDISMLGLLGHAGPVDQFSPNPPPQGSSGQTHVQSLFVRIGWSESDADITATMTFPWDVSILGVVADIEGRLEYIWGASPNDTPSASQLIKAGTIFGVGMDYGTPLGRALEVQGRDIFEFDGFTIDPASNSVTVAGATHPGKSDDFRVLISYDDGVQTGEYFDVSVSEGNGLCVGAEFLGDGQAFRVDLVPEPAGLLPALAGLGLLSRRRRFSSGLKS